MQVQILQIFLCFSYLFFVQSSYYIDPNSKIGFGDGSKGNPFTSLEEAIALIGAQQAEIIIVGQSLLITSIIEFPANCEYIVRGDSSSTNGFVTFIFKDNAYISTSSYCLLTFERIQFTYYETTASAFLTQSFFNFQFGEIFLNNILIQDLDFPWQTDIIYISFYGQMTITDSYFINLTNTRIYSFMGSLTVKRCKFVNITASSSYTYVQFSLFSDYGGNKFTFLENSFNGGRLNNAYIFQVGQASVLFSDFTVQDLAITSGSFFAFALGISINTISAEIQNGIFQNITEEVMNPQIDGTSQLGLIVNQKHSQLVFNNVTFRDIFFNKAPIIKAEGGPNDISLKDIYIENCPNAYIMTSDHNVNIQNMILVNSSYNGKSIETVDSKGTVYPTIFSKNADNIKIENITGRDVYSPFLRTSNIKMIQIYDCDFITATTSLNLEKENQNFLHLTQKSTGSLDNTPGVVYIKNFNLYNYTYIEEPDDTTEIAFASILHLSGRFTNLNIKDSRWINIDTTSIFAEFIDSIQINNLVITRDPDFPSTKLLKKRVFHFLVVGEMNFLNSQLLNNHNANILTFSNPQSADLFKLNSSQILFENITVMNNIATFSSITDILPALFDFYGLLNPLLFTCKSSTFNNNTIANSIFSVQDSSALEIILLNNTFQDNYSKGSGVVYSSNSMKRNLSKLELTGNIFINNHCDGNGGLFSLVNSNCEFIAFDNIYSNTSAKRLGGVGYVYGTDLTYSERNGSYKNAFAGGSGGFWYFNTFPRENKTNQLEFTGTTFSKAHVSEDGGAIYLFQEGLNLKNCLFEENRATTSGGNIYVQKLSSIIVENTVFTKSSAKRGVCVYAEDISGQSFTFKDVKINNIISNETNPVLFNFNFGTLMIIDSEFENISIPLFSSLSSIISFQNVKLHNVVCRNKGQTFCLLEGTPTSLTISDSQIRNITSDFDLLKIDLQEEATFHNVEFFDIKTSNNYDSSIEAPFVLRITTAKNINIQHSKFLNIGFSPVKVKDSVLEITDTIFSNSDSNSRILQQSEQAQGSSSVIFLVAESSNSSIINSTFSNNLTHSSTYTRGAIQVKGDKGVYYISQSTFQGNRAPNGGAIAFENGIYNIEISDSKFNANQAALNGGCIYLADSNPQSSLKINNSDFINNQAQQGGCIFIGSQNVLIQNSNFTKNNAEKGGVIASFVNDNAESNMILRKNIFSENTANIGAVLMAFGKINFDFSDSIFSDNKAQFGNNIASQPDMLRMQVYEFDETFLFLDKITPQILLNHHSTKLVYDSIEPDSNISLNHKTGRSPNYLFMFTLLDKFKQNTQVIDSPSLLTISIKDSTYEKKIKPSLLGRTTYGFEKSSGSILIWKAFSLRGDIDTSVTLSAQTSVIDVLTNQVKLLPSVDWNVKIVPCSQGEIYDEVNVICSPCVEGTFSYEDPYKAESCQECQGPLICKGSNVVYPQEGYWQMNRGDKNVVKCFVKEACLGGEKYDGTDFSFSGFCGENYQGIACGTCRPGYAKFGNSQTCLDCRNTKGYFAKFLAFFLIQILGTIVIIKIYISRKTSNSIRENYMVKRITITKIVIDFIHILNLSYGFTLNWPKAIDFFLYAITKIIPDSRDALSIDCFIVFSSENTEKSFLIKLIVLILQPLVFILASAGTIAFYQNQGKKLLQNEKFMADFRVSSILIIYVLQPYIVKATFQLFKCQNFGSDSSPQYYLTEDTSIECWKSEHLMWIFEAGIFSLIFWFVIPTCALIFIMKQEVKLSKEKFTNKYGWIFLEYNPSLAYWEIITLGIKVIMIVLNTFLRNGYVKIYIGFMSLVIFHYLQVKMKPLNNLGGNIAQQISYLALIFIFYNALFFVPVDDDSNAITEALVSLIFVAATVFLAYCFYLVYQTVKEDIQNRKARKNANLFSVTSQKMKNQEDLKTIFNRDVETVQDLKPSASSRPIQNREANTDANKRLLSLMSEDNPSPLLSPVEMKQFSLFHKGLEPKEHQEMNKKDINNSRLFSDIEASFEEKSPHDNPVMKDGDRLLAKDEKNLQIFKTEDVDDSLIFPEGKMSFQEKSPTDKILMKAVSRSISRNVKKTKNPRPEDIGDSLIFSDAQMSLEERGPSDKKSMRIITRSITKKRKDEKEQEIEDILNLDLKGFVNEKHEILEKVTLEPKIEKLVDSNQKNQNST